ncbi:type I methionyl aminopeptidase [Selenomonas montiformis]|uniref:Methionine aminopeptidase n=1 Tax=Selenomonas montiformis TaxID=2652285 RepID=A0A6I2UXL9_9FIRM|nr:type I methionyl aminopeptidase [Selenomonas montiformis]MDY4697081.1 type I methionyl aminopeptidase [Selenomonas montiformis]MSV23982.1 type I methionyl aminopeptidase [Selenomonas montiformis]
MQRNELCWCGSGRKYKKCHEDFDERLNEMKFDVFRGQVRPPKKIINNEQDIEGIRAAGVINDGALDLAGSMVREGADTASIDQAVHDYIVERGGYPSCLNYEGFPKSCCISINEVVCHGIPSPKTILKEGDILNVDITTTFHGYYADASRMFIVGHASPEAERLVRVTKECMELGIAAAKPWHFLGDVSAACGNHAHENGYSVVTDLGGHGVGKDFHMEPFVMHEGEPETGMLLVPGMVLTVEPMINMGKRRVVVDSKDNWTVRTKDKSLSAQWEKTILITETGTEVLSS